LADVVLKSRCKLLSFFTIIFAVFLRDLASAYQISSKQNHSLQSYDVVLIPKILKIAAMDLENTLSASVLVTAFV